MIIFQDKPRAGADGTRRNGPYAKRQSHYEHSRVRTASAPALCPLSMSILISKKFGYLENFVGNKINSILSFLLAGRNDRKTDFYWQYQI